jgi:hypothetical protein
VIVIVRFSAARLDFLGSQRREGFHASELSGFLSPVHTTFVSLSVSGKNFRYQIAHVLVVLQTRDEKPIACPVWMFSINPSPLDTCFA